ncbi:hypothetical protein HMPREF9969_1842 [Prevotella sp. oral taxon 306 str. F0472]|nr:hypothetical protein HMPREF9969_1842 [Prevotella sp. oral taxon 306 str. F0472]
MGLSEPLLSCIQPHIYNIFTIIKIGIRSFLLPLQELIASLLTGV